MCEKRASLIAISTRIFFKSVRSIGNEDVLKGVDQSQTKTKGLRSMIASLQFGNFNFGIFQFGHPSIWAIFNFGNL